MKSWSLGHNPCRLQRNIQGQNLRPFAECSQYIVGQFLSYGDGRIRCAFAKNAFVQIGEQTRPHIAGQTLKKLGVHFSPQLLP